MKAASREPKDIPTDSKRALLLGQIYQMPLFEDADWYLYQMWLRDGRPLIDSTVWLYQGAELVDKFARFDEYVKKCIEVDGYGQKDKSDQTKIWRAMTEQLLKHANKPKPQQD